MNVLLPLRSSLTLLFGTALLAQTAAEPVVAANRFVPADSCLVARIAAPAKWQQRFQKTQMTKLLQAQAMAPLVDQMRTGVDGMVERLRSSGKFDADLVEKLLHDYTGDVVVSLQVDWDDAVAAMSEQRMPAMSVVLALTPGEGIDLGALAHEIGAATERESEGKRPLRDVTVGDLELRVSSNDDEMQANVPALVDGHLVMLMVFGGEFEAAATRLLGTADRYDGAIGSEPLFVHAKFGPMLATMLPAFGVQADAGGAPFDVLAMLRTMGLGALDTMSMSVTADDAHAAAEFSITLGEGEAGLLGTMLVDEAPKLLPLVPPACDHFGVTHFDWSAFYGTIAGLWDEVSDMVPLTREDAEDAFAEATKVRLREDLIAHLGTEMLSLQGRDETDADVDPEDPMQAFGSMCLGIALRDGKAFGDSLEQALRSRGMHASRKTEEYGDSKIHRLRIAGMLEVEYAVTDGLLLIAPGKGEASRRHLRAVLDAQKQGATELPTVLAAHVKQLPEGWTGISVAPVEAMLDAMRRMIEAAAEAGDAADVPIDLDTAGQVLGDLIGDVRRLGIEHLVAATYTSKRSLKTVMRW